MPRLDNSGPKTDPRGTPQVTVAMSENGYQEKYIVS